MDTEQIFGKECFTVGNKELTLCVTRIGGHMAPVWFHPAGRGRPGEAPASATASAPAAGPFQPYFISPWQQETVEIPFPVLRPLRGDLFCLPFGGNGTDHPPHGETASEEWRYEGTDRNGSAVRLRLAMKTRMGAGSVRKELILAEGHPAVYIRHTVAGNFGAVPFGHHATLGAGSGSLVIRTSPIRFGMTSPHAGNRSPGEYYALAPLERFGRLDSVPTLWKRPDRTDCTRFPAREGFMDVLQLVHQPGSEPGWVTAVCAEGGYLWFSLKDLEVLPSTLVWMENRGRHFSPWNGRTVCIGLEDVCSCFAAGSEASAGSNVLSAEGVPTCRTITPDRPLTVSSIQGTVAIPPGFDAVAEVRFSDDTVLFIAESGARAAANVRPGFLFGEELI